MKARAIKACFLVIICLTFLLCGCKEAIPQPTNELTICVDDYLGPSYNTIVQLYKRHHPDVELSIIIIPEDETRSEFLEKTRAEIMAGKGPDVFLLQNSYTLMRVEDLFTDINKAMQNGAFCDIYPLLEQTDTSLEGISSVFLSAGTVNNKLYTLPLTYYVPVIGYPVGRLEKDGFNVEKAMKSRTAFFNEVADKLPSSAMVGMAGLYKALLVEIEDYCFMYFNDKTPENYEKLKNVLLAQKQIYDNMPQPKGFFVGYSQSELSDSSKKGYPEFYLYENCYGAIASKQMYFTSGITFPVDDPLRIASYFPDEYKMSMEVLPVPNEGEGVTATILDYIAVRANSKNKYNAASLIKLLLSDEYFNTTQKTGVGQRLISTLDRHVKASWQTYFNGMTFSSDKSKFDSMVNSLAAIPSRINKSVFSCVFPGLEDVLKEYLNEKISIEACVEHLMSKTMFYLDE